MRSSLCDYVSSREVEIDIGILSEDESKVMTSRSYLKREVEEEI